MIEFYINAAKIAYYFYLFFDILSYFALLIVQSIQY
jgi:hypothetical protein